jgi:hypothetical protein
MKQYEIYMEKDLGLNLLIKIISCRFVLPAEIPETRYGEDIQGADT